MNKIKVLFVCVHNSVRSQMAEAFLNAIVGDIFEASSAGLEPGVLNPLVVTAMANIGIDISGNKTKSVLEFFKKGIRFEYVISVSDEISGEKCPVFPGIGKRLHWEIEDSSVFKGTYKERLSKIKQVRDTIEKKVREFIKDIIGYNIDDFSVSEEQSENGKDMEMALAKR